jgi:hypothetical protein
LEDKLAIELKKVDFNRLNKEELEEKEPEK